MVHKKKSALWIGQMIGVGLVIGAGLSVAHACTESLCANRGGGHTCYQEFGVGPWQCGVPHAPEPPKEKPAPTVKPATTVK